MLSSIFTSVLALAATVSALTAANTANPPDGNPIGHPGLGELIPAGKSYTITWTPTTPTTGQVSLVLLRGPSTNVVPILTIADSVPNSGSYVWDVPSTLEPDTTHYGVELIVEGTGQYQYSPQCGVSNPDFSSSNSTDDSGSKSAASGSAVSSTTASATSSLVTSLVAVATGTGNFSVPVLTPTKSLSVPASLSTETSTFVETGGATNAVASTPTAAATTASSTPTGAAVANRAGSTVAGLALAAFVAALL